VIHGVDAAQRSTDDVFVAHIADDQFDGSIEIRRAQTIRPVHLRNEAVEDANVVSRGQQFVGEVRADETRATSDQYSFAHCGDSDGREGGNPAPGVGER
jgi:hypothetical protein